MDYYIKVIKDYAVFTGRARRKEYWMFVLISAIISTILGIISGMGGMKDVLSGIYGLAVLIPSIGVAIRRLHDTNRSGWWLFIVLIPLIGAIILIIFLAQDSQPGSNIYGPNPKEGDATPPVTPVPPVTPISPVPPTTGTV